MTDDDRVKSVRYASNLWYPDGDRIDVFATVIRLADGERVTVTATDVGETRRIVAGRDRGYIFPYAWKAVRGMLQPYVRHHGPMCALAPGFEFGHEEWEITVKVSEIAMDKADAVERLTVSCVALAASIVAALCCHDDLIAGPKVAWYSQRVESCPHG